MFRATTPPRMTNLLARAVVHFGYVVDETRAYNGTKKNTQKVYLGTRIVRNKCMLYLMKALVETNSSELIKLFQ